MKDCNDFRCVYCGDRGGNWIRTTTGLLLCDTCGQKQPPKVQPTIKLSDTHETRINYLQGRIAQLESNVGVLQDKVRSLHQITELLGNRK